MAAAGLGPDDTVVEIGPGLGALTFPLVRTGARLICVEADKALAGALRERLGTMGKEVEIINGDALKYDFTALPRGSVVVSNLPYQISSPMIFKLLEAGEAVSRAVLTLQKELADRLLSGPGPKTYGQITVMIGLKAKIESIMTLKPGAFHPRPNVASRCIRLTFGQEPPLPLDDDILFRKVVQAAFGQRRKTLRQALLSAPLGLKLDGWAKVFERAEVEPTLRAEKLSVADFIRLANEAAGVMAEAG